MNIAPCPVTATRIAHSPPHWRAIALWLAALAAILALAWWVYHPGLSGDFLFDDFGNLPAIGASGPVDNWPTFWRYITSGNADPTGRPLTLLSFLIDARNWPAAPYPFKVTNVLLHLLNGALLYAVLLRLGQALCFFPLPPGASGAQRRERVRVRAERFDADEPAPQSLSRLEMGYRIAALFGAGAWLLHPLFVSTTLYIVQREAMLPATFVLLGMLGWIAARGALLQGYVRRGIAGMILSAWGCTLLAALCKANGVLLPLLLLLTEWIVLIPALPMPSRLLELRRRQSTAALLGLPTALVAAYMLTRIPGAIASTPEVRDWTLWQRLLSEPRALCDYLALLFVPRVHSTGLFTDAFVASRNLLNPTSTLPCMAIVFGLIVAGCALHRRHPAIALALLFYFAAQLLESTWIPLELYYEHRNYLPAMLLFWPIGIGLGAPGALRWLRGACAAGILVWLAILTFQRASLWGDGYRQALVWAAFNPDSARAQANAAQYDIAHGRPHLAQARMLNALPAHRRDVQLPVNLVAAECTLHDLRPESIQALRNALASSKVGGTLGFNWFNRAAEMARTGECPGLDFKTMQSLLDAAYRNRWWQRAPGWQQDLAHLQGVLDLAEGKPHDALLAFDQALRLLPKPDAALEQAALLGSRGYPALGLAHLDYWLTLSPRPVAGGMPMLHAWVLREQQYWPRETSRLHATLAADVARKAEIKPTAANAPASG